MTGGVVGSHHTELIQYDSTELLHLQQGSVWQYAASLPSPRYGLRARTVFNKVYIFGGNFPSEDRILSYNGATDEWQEEGGMTVSRRWHQVLVIENVPCSTDPTMSTLPEPSTPSTGLCQVSLSYIGPIKFFNTAG